MNKLSRLFPYILITSLFAISSCSSEKIEEIDCEIFGPTLELSEIIDAGCIPSGSITVSVVGGYGDLMYSLDGINFQTSPTFSDLSSNDYTIEVVDAEGCTDVIMASVGNTSSDLSFTATTTTGGCGTEEGTIIVNATGGAGGYAYRLGTGNFVATNTFENISGGSYNVSVKDTEECISEKTVKVLSGVSFSSIVKPIIDNNCSVTTCHGSDPTLLNFSTYAGISGNAQKIRTQVENGTMPPEDNLTQNQIDQILCWIDDGAVDN